MTPAPHLHQTLLRLIALRAALVSVLFGSTVIRVSGLGTAPFDPLFFVIGLTYALTAFYAVSLRYLDRRPWLVDVHLVSDVALVSAFVLVTGGVDSYFTSLFVLPVAAASVVRRPAGGGRVAWLSGLLLVSLVVGQYAGVFPNEWTGEGTLPPWRVAISTVGLNVLGFAAVGRLTGYLAERLQAADQHLERASNALEDLKALNQSVIDSLTGGLATSDLDGTVLTFNRAAEVISGKAVADVRGTPIARVLQLPVDVARLLEDRLSAEQPVRTEYRYSRQDGAVLDLGLTMAPLVNANRCVGCLFTFQDLTEMKRLEREAEKQKRLAAVGQMAAGIAHEIRNPLASMSGAIQVLRHELRLSDEQAQLMDIVLRESERLNDIIESFLIYARPGQRSPKPVDVSRLLAETAALLRHSPECGSAHEVVVDAPVAALWHEADESQLRQVVWNLATNGLRAMREGGRLTLSARRGRHERGEGLWLDVRDEGVGIASEDIDGIFQPFRSTFARGTGLGLAIVHRIVVSDSGGDIRLESTPGQGTCVRVFLPDPTGTSSAAGVGAPTDIGPVGRVA